MARLKEGLNDDGDNWVDLKASSPHAGRCLTTPLASPTTPLPSKADRSKPWGAMRAMGSMGSLVSLPGK